eukprot:scaffold779_cov355-Prasinococcus_capsulatus_cf.AAC.7
MEEQAALNRQRARGMRTFHRGDTRLLQTRAVRLAACEEGSDESKRVHTDLGETFFHRNWRLHPNHPGDVYTAYNKPGSIMVRREPGMPSYWGQSPFLRLASLGAGVLEC